MKSALHFSVQLQAVSVRCLHCGQFVIGHGDFCCQGCAAVYSFIHDHGLNHYYDLRKCEITPQSPADVLPNNNFYAYCDDPNFISAYSSDGLSMKFYIEGIQCLSCLWLLEKLPEYCADAVFARVDAGSSTLLVKRSVDGSFSAVANTLARLGYTPRPLSLTDNGESFRMNEDRKHLVRLGIAAVSASNIMFLAIANYAGAADEFHYLFSWLSAALALPTLTYCAFPIYSRVGKDLKQKKISLDTPIALALIMGFALSVFQLTRGKETYFDSLTTLVFLLLVSRYILKKAQNRNLGLTSRANLAFNATVELINPSALESKFISSLSLKVGDVFMAQGNDTLAVDGIIRSGHIDVDRSILTGESEIARLSPGEIIEAGFKVLNGSAEILVTATGASTRLSQTLAQAELVFNKNNSLTDLTDKVGVWFTYITLAVAFTLLGIFIIQGDSFEGLQRALTLIIVSCPCVFGMAIPLASSLAMKNASQNGALFRDSSAIDMLYKASSVFFDKTGTLTKGTMQVIRTIPEVIQPRLLAATYALEKQSTHPVGVALRNHICQLSPLLPEWNFVAKDIPGGGRQLRNDKDLFEIKPMFQDACLIERNRVQGHYGLYVNGELSVTFELEDQVQTDIATVVSKLSQLGLNSGIISGDMKEPTLSCARIAEIPEKNVYYRALPIDKMKILESNHPAIMVGDGANDAAALNAASVGIAVRGAMNVSLKSASIYLVNSNLKLIPWLIELSKNTRNTVLITLSFSTLFNIAAATTAILGHMNPLIAALLMPLSSFTVLCITIFRNQQMSTP